MMDAVIAPGVGAHVGELNIAHPRFALDHPRMADFMNNLDTVNALAERTQGFVWRLTGDGNNATDLSVPGDPDAIANLSVWESPQALEHFMRKTIHARFYHRKSEWFMTAERRDFVMWPLTPGHRPTLEEALARLSHLRTNGTSDVAFGWDGIDQMRAWVHESA
ncbi:MAG: DUF3291 domain-containing protein [Devosia sp.]